MQPDFHISESRMGCAKSTHLRYCCCPNKSTAVVRTVQSLILSLQVLHGRPAESESHTKAELEERDGPIGETNSLPPIRDALTQSKRNPFPPSFAHKLPPILAELMEHGKSTIVIDFVASMLKHNFLHW